MEPARRKWILSRRQRLKALVSLCHISYTFQINLHKTYNLLVSDHCCAELSNLARILGQMNSHLETISAYFLNTGYNIIILVSLEDSQCCTQLTHDRQVLLIIDIPEI